jgi:hypothetical protein
MKYVLSLVVASLMFVGCSRNTYGQMSRFHDDGRAKPSIVFTPVFDRNDIELPWKLSDELTYSIQTRLARKNSMFVIPDRGMTSVEQHIQAGKNPFVGDYEWIKESYDDGEFVVFLELVKHNVHEKDNSKSLFAAMTPNYVLDMTMRVRVFDLRDENPKIILQELVSQKHMIPKQLAKMDFAKSNWGKKTYNLSPMGLAHAAICREVAKRVEEYLLLAKSQSYVKRAT